MTTSLLTRVKSKLFIHSLRRSLSILEGEYRSLSFGRSTDFEDLREYEIGDDIKDIDWKASARSSGTLIRRYIASRRHTVLVVTDTGVNMKAIAPSGEPKYELQNLALGMLGYLSVRHTDSLSALYGDSQQNRAISAKSTESHLERILQSVRSATIDNANRSDIMSQLRYVASNYKQRHIVVVVADEFTPNEENLSTLRLLRAKHDLLWISIADADPIKALESSGAAFDVSTSYRMPDFIRKDKALIADFLDQEEQRRAEMGMALDGLRIPRVELEDSGTVVGKLIVLLERRRKQRGN
jgi:uncharacterized protein (DUF58 family)